VFEEAFRAAQVPFRVASGDGVLDHPAVRATLNELRRRPPARFAMVAADLEDAAAPVERASAASAGDRSAAAASAGDRSAAAEDEERRVALAGVAALARTYERTDQQPTTEGFLGWLRASRGENPSEDPRGAVTVSSFHRAKGLEWLAVWVTGLEHGLVPNGHAVTAAAQAEERRLLYVALTRAERELHCSWAERRHFSGRPVPRQPCPWLDLIARANSADAPADTTDLWRQRLSGERDRLGRSQHRGDCRPDADPAVVDALRSWRAAAARAAAVPPYVLLHDGTLTALATARPATLEELVAVPGIGQVKAARYGATLLAVVADHRASA
jgi:DNA helicase-2/ATP-dependent DNA helicase PcrA